MEISKYRFEEELDSLIRAAFSTSSKDSAEAFLNKAENKIYAYDNIPSDLKRLYLQKVEDAKDELGL